MKKVPSINHNYAIHCITKRLSDLNEKLKVDEKIMENPEMQFDYMFAKNSAANIELEINSLTETVEFLLKQLFFNSVLSCT